MVNKNGAAARDMSGRGRIISALLRRDEHSTGWRVEDKWFNVRDHLIRFICISDQNIRMFRSWGWSHSSRRSHWDRRSDNIHFCFPVALRKRINGRKRLRLFNMCIVDAMRPTSRRQYWCRNMYPTLGKRFAMRWHWNRSFRACSLFISLAVYFFFKWKVYLYHLSILISNANFIRWKNTKRSEMPHNPISKTEKTRPKCIIIYELGNWVCLCFGAD